MSRNHRCAIAACLQSSKRSSNGNMSRKVKIATILQEYIDVPDAVEVSGNTVGECIHDLIRQYPEARNLLLDQNGPLPVLVSINNEDTVALNRDGLDKDLDLNDELMIFAVFEGG